MLGEVRALECRGVRAFPDVGIALRVDLLIEPTFFIQNIRGLRIVAPVRPNDDRVVGLFCTQEVVNSIALAPGVPARPEL
jgi:hypothetical protein